MKSLNINIIITIAAILISYGISAFLPSTKTKIIAFGVGATIIFWVWLISYANHVYSPKSIGGENAGTKTKSKVAKELKFPDHKFTELPEKITITFGSNSVSYKTDILRNKKAAPFSVADIKIFAFIENNTLYADSEIFGGKNQQPIYINKNTLSLLPNGWDFNSTNKALEIVNENKIPMYQLIYKTPNHIEINGVFVAKGGLILANSDGIQFNPPLPIPLKLNRIFKYPSFKYDGEYEEESR